MIEDAGLTPLSFGGRKRRQINPPILRRGEGPDISLKAYEEAKTEEERQAIRKHWADESLRERARDRMLIS